VRYISLSIGIGEKNKGLASAQLIVSGDVPKSPAEALATEVYSARPIPAPERVASEAVRSPDHKERPPDGR